MGKLLCDSSTAVSETLQSSSSIIPWRDPTTTSVSVSLDAIGGVDESGWENVAGLEDQQKRHLRRLHAEGVLWNHPAKDDVNSSGNKDKVVSNDASNSPPPRSVVFRLSHGGDVEADGNCLFTASQKAMGCASSMDARELRRRTVKRFWEDLGTATERELMDRAIKHMYSPDLKSGWGIHVVQEVKLLASKLHRQSLDSDILHLLHLGMHKEMAAESIYKERCIAVDDGPSWAKYMSISGSPDDEYDIITLQYTEDGLLSVDENREGHAAAFGDDIAIQCLATEFNREIYVVQAHGSDAMVDEENCVFFLPHRPRGQICDLPIFLFMKGTGWCGAGADHYEPLIAHHSSLEPQEKVAVVL